MLFVIYGGAVYVMLTVEREHPMCRIVVQMDIVMFLLQFLMYNFYSIYHSRVNAIDAKKSKIAQQLSMNMQNQMVLKSTESKYILKQREIIKKNEREAM